MRTHDTDTTLLQQQLESYRQEKEQLRKVIDQLGGKKSKRRNKAINAVFVVVICLLFAHSMLREFFGISLPGLSPLLSMELAVLLVSVKIIWMIHLQSQIEHFQVTQISKRLKDMESRG